MGFPEVHERYISSFDGTELACHTYGAGPSVLLCNGLGGSWKAWSHQMRHFVPGHKFTSWDYRGLYRSRAPRDRHALSVTDHALDGLAVMDALGIDRTVLFGWSMGVQVALEIFRAAPERVSGIVLLNGLSGRLFSTVANVSAFELVAPSILRGAGRMPGFLSAATQQLVRVPGIVKMAKLSGMAAPTLDEEIFDALAASFGGLDMGLYVRVLEALGTHDASDLLAHVDVPTLVIAGERDMLTPRAAMERMSRRIPGSELYTIEGGTHYLAIEYPEMVNLRIAKFFEERGLSANSSR